MCRLLAVKSPTPLDIREHLRRFAQISRHSLEYQGHGWGCARLQPDGSWSLYHNIKPVWEDDVTPFEPTTLLLAHARSAFRDEGIAVENNMPFQSADGRLVFIFNGELHGVKIREDGRIGAEKIFNFIQRFRDGDLAAALHKGAAIIEKRSRLVKSMNIILSDGRGVHVSSTFTERPEYFTMHQRRGARLDAEGGAGFIICSDPLPGVTGWQPIARDEPLTLS